MKEILSLGAGVQSSTLLLMSCAGELPKLDAAIFADTQWEPEKVYAWLEYLKEQAAKAGIPIIVRTVGNIRTDILDFWYQRKSADGKRHASIPAFIKNPDKTDQVQTLWGIEDFTEEGTRGKTRRQCTGTYKIDLIELATRQILGLKKKERWPTEPSVRQWIGISADELHRLKKDPRPAIRLWYPLVHHLVSPRKKGLFKQGYDRQDCIDWMKRTGHPEPPRSACIGCPFHSDAEWVAMKRDFPHEFEDACQVDELIRANDDKRNPGDLIGKPYLHDSLIPLRMVEFDPSCDVSSGRGMSNECVGVCGV